MDLDHKQVITKTIEELGRVIEMRSQGIWHDPTDADNDIGNEVNLTGCSVVPTREVVKIWEQLTGEDASKQFNFSGSYLPPNHS